MTCKVCCSHRMEPKFSSMTFKCIDCGAERDPRMPTAVFSEEEWEAISAAFEGRDYDCGCRPADFALPSNEEDFEE